MIGTQASGGKPLFNTLENILAGSPSTDH